ncbi:ankyrin repeat domain-containing protein [Agrococcus casei]|uniref:ankyrin repeat domain-containing protein n=1 Tax=Agrococcus casei TaxID=343512 RepID=UPI003F91A628
MELNDLDATSRTRDFALALWERRDADAMQILCEWSPKDDDRFHYRTPLDWAASLGAISAVERLLELTQYSDTYLEEALSNAVACGQVSAAEYLVRRGVNVEGGLFDSPLALATQFGNPVMVEVLLKLGADVNGRNNFEQTILMQCATWAGIIRDYPDTLFTETLVYVSALPGFAGRSWKSLVPLPDHLAVAKLLIRAGASLTACDHNGLTAIDYAEGRTSKFAGRVESTKSIDRGMVSLLASA